MKILRFKNFNSPKFVGRNYKDQDSSSYNRYIILHFLKSHDLISNKIRFRVYIFIKIRDEVSISGFCIFKKKGWVSKIR
eukprot:snap_masked-scaffold_1-processed-gene-13.30-mRNA-1 protein AED:1.00 eAED:1.00 QI:0/0/0/0/1/1/2/0/78